MAAAPVDDAQADDCGCGADDDRGSEECVGAVSFVKDGVLIVRSVGVLVLLADRIDARPSREPEQNDGHADARVKHCRRHFAASRGRVRHGDRTGARSTRGRSRGAGKPARRRGTHDRRAWRSHDGARRGFRMHREAIGRACDRADVLVGVRPIFHGRHEIVRSRHDSNAPGRHASTVEGKRTWVGVAAQLDEREASRRI